jgi:uncharacterized membrane protein YqjE
VKAPAKLTRTIGGLLPQGAGEEVHRARVLTVAGLALAAIGVLTLVTQVIMWALPASSTPPATDLVMDVMAVLVGGLLVWLVRSSRRSGRT